MLLLTYLFRYTKVTGNDAILRSFEKENYRENQANKGGYSEYVANGYQRMSMVHVVKVSERKRERENTGQISIH